MELKFNQDSREIASNLLQDFPFRITKSSKYIIGTDYLKHLHVI